MEYLSSNIDSQFFFTNRTGFWIISRLLFVINNKILIFFGIYLMPRVLTHIMFPILVRKIFLIIFRKLHWDNQTSIIIIRQNSEIFTAFFFQEMFQCQIESKHHIFFLHQLIFPTRMLILNWLDFFHSCCMWFVFTVAI